MSAREQLPVLCRIRRCELPARWIVTMTEHPNSGTIRSAYCGRHAESPGCLLWDDAPRPYTVTAAGPFDPAALRAALGAAETREHLASKMRQQLELAGEQPTPEPEPAEDRDAWQREGW